MITYIYLPFLTKEFHFMCSPDQLLMSVDLAPTDVPERKRKLLRSRSSLRT